MGRKPKSDKGKSKCQRQDEQWHREGNFAPMRNFRTMVRNSLLLFFLCFCSFFPSDSDLMLSSTQILHDLIDSTNLALIACKNYKISHKMRSVE